MSAIVLLGETEIDENSVEDQSEDGKTMSNKELKLQSCVRAISADEVPSIDISQVLVPSVGFAVKLPENEMAEWFHEMLQEDGMTVQTLKHKQKNFAVSGAYRTVVVNPMDVKHEILYYTDPCKSLVASDMDIISSRNGEGSQTHSEGKGSSGNGAEKCEGSTSSPGTAEVQAKEDTLSSVSYSSSSSTAMVTDESRVETSACCETKNLQDTSASDSSKQSEQKGALKAVIVQFSLPPSCYATMVLRELMKMDTSSQFHSNLNTNPKASGNSEKKPWKNFQQHNRQGTYTNRHRKQNDNGNRKRSFEGSDSSSKKIKGDE